MTRQEREKIAYVLYDWRPSSATNAELWEQWSKVTRSMALEVSETAEETIQFLVDAGHSA